VAQWYTSTRSIPAGELWRFPIAGVKKDGGERLVGRVTPSSQIGPQEPFYSPDGQFVYYRYVTSASALASSSSHEGGARAYAHCSKNEADSTFWNYNKDPHAGIFAISRVSITTKATEQLAGGPGGVRRPL
jgi:hypothetical protein